MIGGSGGVGQWLTAAVLLLTALLQVAQGGDVSDVVFGSASREFLPAAFGDFNSDELTDVFVLRNDYKTVEVMLGAEEEPLLRPSLLSCNFTRRVTSVVPGDYDGDAYMDVLVTTVAEEDDEQGGGRENHVHVLWGHMDKLNCTTESLITLQGQPLAIDYNQDMIVDLFGVNQQGERTFWVFGGDGGRDAPIEQRMPGYDHQNHVRRPHSNAFLDLNDDHMADLFVTGTEQFEVWHGVDVEDEERLKDDSSEFTEHHDRKHHESRFVFSEQFDVKDEDGKQYKHVGQSVFVDVELRGRMELVLPVCRDTACKEGSGLVMRGEDGSWKDMRLQLRDPATGRQWRWLMTRDVHSEHRVSRYVQALTVRSGDYNMDGYPDLLAVLTTDDARPRAFLLENVARSGPVPNGTSVREFRARWSSGGATGHGWDGVDGVVAAAFYDLYQDGVLDVVCVFDNGTVAAYRNGLDYDANFVKVMVVTGLNNARSPAVVGRLGTRRKRRTFGTNLPGPAVSYRTTTQDGGERHGASAQLPQSAHHALASPFTVFGLGRTPNFVDSLSVGLSGRCRHWTQIIPNSQVVVIPWPAKDPARWRAQLFVTPSKLILMSVAALTAVCGLITCIIAALYWRERQEDRKERMQESHRFHFDAM